MSLAGFETPTVLFTKDEIELAQLFKAYGLDWNPTCGQYVLDQSNLVECSSPFQDRVFFILDLKHFLRRAGNLDELKRRLCWLPDWHEARNLLRQMGVSSDQVAERLAVSRAIEFDAERLELYRIIEEQLTGSLGL